jgi:hypothetical protein
LTVIEHLLGCWRCSGATIGSMFVVLMEGSTRLASSRQFEERHGSSESQWIEPLEDSDVCDDDASTEKIEEDEEEAEDETEP